MKNRTIGKIITLISLLSVFVFSLASCNNSATYEQITQKEAKDIMDTEKDYIIVDARERDEYASGHIAGAICIPHGEITEEAEELLPDKGQLILVYCRSGRRSKIASQALADMGYTNVKEFGGINTWQYGTVR